MHIPAAWAVSDGTNETIAIIDSGISPSAELPRVLPGRNFVFDAGHASPPDTACLNALCSAATRAGDFQRSLATLDAGLAAGLPPDAGTALARIQALSGLGRFEQAVDSYRQATAAPQRPTARLLSAALGAAGRGGLAPWSLLEEALARDCQGLDALLFTSLIDACGADADSAWRAWALAATHGCSLERWTPALSAMLCCFAKARDAKRALLFFDLIRPSWPGRKPPEVTYLLLRDAAAAAGDVEAQKTVAAIMAAELRSSRPPPLIAHDDSAPRRGAGAAVATFVHCGVEMETRNGEQEENVGGEAARLLAGAGPALVASLGERYTPDLSCVGLMAGGEAAQQRAALASHAEKKALGALLLRGGARGMVSVRVSIRLCRDCHACFEAASEVHGATIEAWDGHRHVFVDGACSCGGRWR